MYVKNLKTGDIETLSHGPATDAVSAGTHEFVNLDEAGKEKGGEAVSPDPMLKPEKPVETDQAAAAVPVKIVADETAGKAKK